MFGPKLAHPGQPFWKWSVLRLFEFASSLELAVILIFSCAAALGWATFVESAYGTPAVQFGVYQTWWFALINLLLAINIFCAAAIRYPWKRYQTGFVITHLGLLVLLFGCLMQRNGGIDAQLPIFEGQTGHRAFEDTHHFELTLTGRSEPGKKAEVIEIPFIGGPFNWDDYAGRLSRPMASNSDDGPLVRAISTGFARLNGMVFRLATRDRGALYDRNGVKLEVLDYYADSTEVDVPLVRLRLSTPGDVKLDADGKPVEGAEQWMPVGLSVAKESRLSNRFGRGGRERVGGGSLVFMLAGSQAEVEAFVKSQPDGSLGKQGQLVLFAAGEVTRVNVDDKLNKGRFPLGDSGVEAEVVDYWPTATVRPNSATGRFDWVNDEKNSNPDNPSVTVKLYRGDKQIGKLLLLADLVEYSAQDHDANVFGSYWFDHGKKTAAELLQGSGGSRIDILQGPLDASGKAKLYYRNWNRQQVIAAEELPLDGTPVNAFKMPMAQLKLKVDQLIPSARPERRILPLVFDATKNGKIPAAKLRLTVDDKSEEFWLAAIPGGSDDRRLFPSEQRSLASDKRFVTVTMPPDEIDVGFGVRLKDFERKLDPGTSQASHYSSVVDFVERESNRALQQDILITMNAPIDFSDPKTGRSYRLFQESFFGPIRPGSPEYDRYAGSLGRDEIYMSTLTVNFDPGRAVKYTGCLLVVAGIATMFYMRAYFFKPQGKAEASNATADHSPRHRSPIEVLS
jgi:hypothetical protein